MSELLTNTLNLDILDNICSGVGVEVNINALSKMFRKHRNTVKSQVNALIENKIINKPIYPFMYLYKEYPILVVVRADLPKNNEIDRFLREDEHIFGAFYVRDEEYNTLLIEYHSDIYHYGQWKKKIVNERKIPPREMRYPAHALFFSNDHIIKYQPHSPINTMEERLKNGEKLVINDFEMNMLGFQILKALATGNGLRTNENMLAQDLDVHRKTIERRISLLLKKNIISKPVCRFPLFFVPPDHILVYCLVEIKKSRDNIIKVIKTDPNIPLALETSMGRYNLLLFKVFSNVEEHFKWEERYDSRFPDSLGAMKKIILSPQMTASIDQQKVSLSIIRNKKEIVHGRELMESVSQDVK
jgi:predicted transcriptional regulator